MTDYSKLDEIVESNKDTIVDITGAVELEPFIGDGTALFGRLHLKAGDRLRRQVDGAGGRT